MKGEIKMQNLSKEKLEKSKITIEELMTCDDDICVIVPRAIMFFSMWLLSFKKDKYENELFVIKKHIELQKKYYYINYKKDIISNYIMPLEEAKIMIGAVKNNISLKQINIVNILKSEFKRFESDINEEFFKLERIKILKEKKYLTIEEKRELISYGEEVPICVGDNSSNKNVRGVVPYYSIYQDKQINLDGKGPSLVKKKR